MTKKTNGDWFDARRSGRVRMAVVGLVFAEMILLAHGARADKAFPSAVQDALGLSCTPDCLLCHETSPGQLGNAKQPFGKTMAAKLGNPLMLGDPSTVKPTLEAIADAGTDSDGDGDKDIDELRLLRNPSVVGPNDPVCSRIRYGCGAHVAAKRSVDSLGCLASLAIVLGLGAMVLRRRARGVGTRG